MAAKHIPLADMPAVVRSSRGQRLSLISFAPRTGMSIMDYATLDRIDDFYIDAQNLRDYYRDCKNKLPKPESFRLHHGKCGTHEFDINTMLFSLPPTWIYHKQPIVCAQPCDKEMHLSEKIDLSGRYDTMPCFRRKR